jgi:type II secretion system protein I
LLEVLLALTIFVGAAAALSRLLLVGLENAEYAEWQTIGNLIAETRFAELDAGIITVDDEGPYDDELHDGWEWQLSTQETDVDGLYQVTVTVEKVSSGPGQGFSTELTRWFFDAGGLTSAETNP